MNPIRHLISYLIRIRFMPNKGFREDEKQKMPVIEDDYQH